jgi:hypothetical protein
MVMVIVRLLIGEIGLAHPTRDDGTHLSAQRTDDSLLKRRIQRASSAALRRCLDRSNRHRIGVNES